MVRPSVRFSASIEAKIVPQLRQMRGTLDTRTPIIFYLLFLLLFLDSCIDEFVLNIARALLYNR